MTKHRKNRGKLGRKPNIPLQTSQKEQTMSSYGGFIPFLSVAGKKVTPIRPSAEKIRRWSRNNPVVRRCIDIIKDRLSLYPIRFDSNDGKLHRTEIDAVKYCFSHPNNDDDELSFRSQVTEDLVVGDCGAWEIRTSPNPSRPFFLFPTDGFTMSIVLNDDTYAYAQKVVDDVNTSPENYVFFKPTEMVYLKKRCVTNTPYGLSPIEVAFKQIQTLMDTFDFSADVASNAVPKYLANIKGLDNDRLASYRVYFERECMGTPNLPIVSADDVSAVQIAPVSEEATFKEYQQFVISMLAMAFNIPPEKVGVTKSNDRSKVTEIDDSLISECIKPYANVVISALNKTLNIVGMGFITASIEYGETDAQRKTNLDLIKQQWQGDMITYNEMRILMGYPVTSEEYGTSLYSEYKAKLNAEYASNVVMGNQNAVKEENNKTTEGGE